MNVQNAKELTITEGDVRTIHDSNGKQLWGKLAYDTKYAGDTTQATYSGKNLQPLFADGSITSSQTMTAGRLTLTQFYSGYNQTLTADGGTLSSTSTGTSIWKMTFTGLTPSTQYTISADFEIALNGTDKKFFALGNYRYNQPDTVTGRFAHTFTTDASGEWVSSSSTNETLFYLYDNSSCTVSNIQLETGATATDYQQYVGGTPSPNPDYPQAINVVKGTQTITLTDGVVSDSFTVNLGENLFNVNTITKGKILDGSGNLFTASDWSTSDFITVESSTQYTLSRHATSSGQYAYLCKYKADGTHIERIYLAPDTTTYTFTTDSDCAKVRISDVTVNINTVQLNIGTSVVPVIELAKIGTYQDYIYKSGGNWYVHKAIKKITLNGTENWTKPQDDYVYRLDGDYSDMVGASIDNAGISDYFVYWANTDGILNNLPNGQFGFVGTLTSINFRNDSTTTSTAFKTWLQSNNTTVYYALATPTDTLVTDATLISQLEAIHEWLTRYGYQSSVVGSLPIIISQTNL